MAGRRSRRTPYRITAVALLAVAGVVVQPSPAVAQPVACGAVLTEDTTLTTDLIDCPGDGLVIGAPGITVDLGGHTVDGQINQGGSPDQVGVDNSAGHDDVTIRNGAVSSFERGGVHLAGADRNLVTGLDMFLFSDFGILSEGGGADNRFADNRLRSPGTVGIEVRGAATPVSRDNVISGNRVTGPNTAGIALRSGSIAATVIDGNEVTGNSAEEQWGAGIVVSYGPGDITGATVRNNTVYDNSGGGVFVGGAADRTVVERNRLWDNFSAEVENNGDHTAIRLNTVSSRFAGLTGVGIRLEAGSEHARVQGNRIRGAAFAGIEDSGRDTEISVNVVDGQFENAPESWGGIWAGVVVRPESRDARFRANSVLRQMEHGFLISGQGTRLDLNVVDSTRYGDGVRIEPAAVDVRIARTLATRHRDDGIDVDSPATTLTGNLATDNGDLGIEAVAGVNDGGGNRAARNDNPAQCVGVTCAAP